MGVLQGGLPLPERRGKSYRRNEFLASKNLIDLEHCPVGHRPNCPMRETLVIYLEIDGDSSVLACQPEREWNCRQLLTVPQHIARWGPVSWHRARGCDGNLHFDDSVTAKWAVAGRPSQGASPDRGYELRTPLTLGGPHGDDLAGTGGAGTAAHQAIFISP
jgi:hypothetical protein